MIEAREAIEVLEFSDRDKWETWLEAHHADKSHAWLRIAKKSSTVAGLSIADALDGALCFGWIDGQRRSLDADAFLQRYSPRSRRSPWSQMNVENVARLQSAGRIRPPGQAAVDAARADGRWDRAYASQRIAEVPADLAAALTTRPNAASAFSELGRTDRYLIILDILKAHTEERRTALIERHLARLDIDPSESLERS